MWVCGYLWARYSFNSLRDGTTRTKTVERLFNNYYEASWPHKWNVRQFLGHLCY